MNFNIDFSFLRRVTSKDKAFFARQLSTMLASGLPLNRAILILAQQERTPTFKRVLDAIQEDLEAGASFSTAIAKHPEVFDRVFVNIVVSGETVGQLAEVLERLADQLGKDTEFTSKVKGAFAYPAFIFIAMVIVAGIMMVYIVPQLQQVFLDANANLPLTTRTIIALSSFLKSFWWVVIAVLVIVYLLGRTYLQSKNGRRLSDQIQLRLPGGIGQEIYLTRFTRTLGTLIQAGTPIIEALNVTAAAVNNSYYEDVLKQAVQEVKRGVPLSSPVNAHPELFPSIVSQMVLVGEQTGQLDKILLSLAEYYESEVDTKLKAISSLVEPVVIVVIGIAVGFLVYSILVPIYNIAQLS